MLITTGAPIKEVIMLMGKLPFGKIWAIQENKSIAKIPDKMTNIYKGMISVRLNKIRQICGTANPMNATGPTNAVAEAVKIAEEIKMNHLVFWILIPIVCA